MRCGRDKETKKVLGMYEGWKGNARERESVCGEGLVDRARKLNRNLGYGKMGRCDSRYVMVFVEYLDSYYRNCPTYTTLLTLSTVNES